MIGNAAGGQGREWAARPEFWREVFDHLSAGLAVLDPCGRIVAVNLAAGELLGRTASAMTGQDFHSLLHHHTNGAAIPDKHCRLLMALTRRMPSSAETDSFLSGDGRPIPVSWFSSPLTRNGHVLGTTVLFTGDTTGRETEEGLAAHVIALEDLADRLTLAAEIATALAQTLDTEEAIARLGRLLVPRLADWLAIDLRRKEGIRRVAVVGPEDRDGDQKAWRGLLPAADEHSRSALVRVLRGGGPVLLGPKEIATPPDSPLAAVQTGFLQALGAVSAVIVPLGTAQQVTGALTLARTGDPPFDATEVALIGDIGRRVGLAIDNTLLFGRQREIAEAMQRNLLIALPQPGRLRMAARYQPAAAGSQVGGDWYDAFPLRDGATALVIGDVVGHDLAAAAGMAQLHGMLRSLAWDRMRPPSAIMDRLDEAIPVITNVPMATAIYARVEGPEEGPWRLRWTSAGHPPPLLITREGRAEYLEQGQGLLLGTGLDGASRPDATIPLPPGSTLFLYTDGLIEVPGTELDTSLLGLRRHAAALARHSLDDFCDQILARMPAGTMDDIAMLAVRVPAAAPPGRR
ncbi:PAS domain S-box-containing protein [Thermocatellispora tengchongensis]|uniref:protein-serine/threonine phosphatase n=1 Tax=Thermocatellispora tengchongensis TaxID=1073253 RepID=A0A840P1R9_9ACTN|nr:SpoIIE family protein phosphatase [Thermocatellispora tengchongensis]MBB5132929.1 PAS domain S-box-containing protein [Thermocatellispora tengchongensis]